LAKKANWKTLAGLALAAATWRSIAEDLPIHDLITPPQPPDPRLPTRYTECPEGFYRKLIGGQWRCWPVYVPPPRRRQTAGSLVRQSGIVKAESGDAYLRGCYESEATPPSIL